jgi:flagellar hook-associated protein 3 FlgL
MVSSVSRITHHSMGMTVLAGLQGNLTRVGKLQEQLSSGRQISRPSDSPSGTVSALVVRGQLRANAQYSRNATDGIGWLSTADVALTGVMDSARRVRELTLQGMSTGVASPESRAAIAAEVDTLREGLLGLANTAYLDRPVFGGTTSGLLAYDTNGAYLGDTNQVHRRVGDNATVRVDVSGPEVFGTGANNLFGVVADISTHLRNDPTLLGNDLGRLDIVMKQVLNGVADIGARQGRIESLQQVAEDRSLSLRSTLSEIEDIDLPATIVALEMQQAAYQAALGAAQRVIQPSLVDFLR